MFMMLKYDKIYLNDKICGKEYQQHIKNEEKS